MNGKVHPGKSSPRFQFLNRRMCSLEENVVNAEYAGKFTHVGPLLKGTFSVIAIMYGVGVTDLEERHTSARNVGKHSAFKVPFEYTRGPTLERNPINVSSVARLSAGPVPFRYTRGLTPERSPTRVRNVARLSFIKPPTKDT